VLFIDLDDFKKINDTLGHDVGDKLLIEAAQRFRLVVREGDTVGRHGGDEFLILLEDIDSAEAAERVARDVVRDFASPFSINDVDMLVTASVGIALFPDDGGDTSTLLRNADAAMYTAKEAGRNSFRFFALEMNQAAVQRVELERHLLGALERGEFSLCFQPQMELRARRVVAVEALIRWHSPSLGQVPPLHFIPLAEQTGLVVAIGNWVLDEALRTLAAWRADGCTDLRMAVNVSPRQFQAVVDGQDLADLIAAALARHRVPAAALEIEITEGLLVKNWTQTRPLLDRLHAAGVRIAMDDFGTGYSSLAYLRSFPFDALKIDGSFIRELPHKSEDRTLVSAIVAMAASLQVDVVAEGVESEAQLAILRERGCHVAQGHLIGMPVDAATMRGLLAA
jgi:diguanylate cyclase (GGDEF)-like protein